MRIFFSGDPEVLGLASRAIAWLMEHPDQKNTILVYGEKDKVEFNVRRNKTCISVVQIGAARP